MRLTTSDAVKWAPRITGIGLALFLSLFALDSFASADGLLSTTIAVIMGLVPALVVLGTVLVGWKHEPIAALIFFGLAAAYGLGAADHVDWIVLIASPLILVGALFLLSWWFHRSGRADHVRA